LIASAKIEDDFAKVGQHADQLRARLLDAITTATPTDDKAGECLARLAVSLNVIPASHLLQIALADDLLECRVVPVVEAAIGMAAADLADYRDAGELLCMFADLADAALSTNAFAAASLRRRWRRSQLCSPSQQVPLPMKTR
jgi:hypothetical protein